MSSSLDLPIVQALLDPATLAAMRRLEGLGKVRRGFRGQRWVLDFGRRLQNRRFVYTWNGQPFQTRAEAEAIMLQVRRHVAEGLSVENAVAMILGDDVRENSVGARLDRWIETKRAECEAGDISPTYLEKLERWLRPDGHIRSWWGDKPITAVNLSTVRQWATWLNGRARASRRKKDEEPRKLSPKSRWNVHAALSAFVRWSAQEDRRVRLPDPWPWPTLDEPSIPIISVDTQQAILDAIPEKKRGLFLAMAHLGIRPGEAVALEIADYREGWLTVSRARKGELLTSPIRSTKTRRPKRLPVSDELREWIETSHDARSRLKGGPLFPNPTAHDSKRRWSGMAMRWAWSKACRKVGVTVPLYAGTKHATATHLLAQGVQERTIQSLLGHADVRSTRRYARLGDQALIEAVQRRRTRAADTPQTRNSER